MTGAPSFLVMGQGISFRRRCYLPHMNVPPNLSGPQGHIYHTDIRTWDKEKAYAREHRKAPTPAEQALW